MRHTQPIQTARSTLQPRILPGSPAHDKEYFPHTAISLPPRPRARPPHHARPKKGSARPSTTSLRAINAVVRAPEPVPGQPHGPGPERHCERSEAIPMEFSTDTPTNPSCRLTGRAEGPPEDRLRPASTTCLNFWIPARRTARSPTRHPAGLTPRKPGKPGPPSWPRPRPSTSFLRAINAAYYPPYLSSDWQPAPKSLRT